MVTTHLESDDFGQYLVLPPDYEFEDPQRKLTVQRVGDVVTMFPTPRTRDEVLAILEGMPEAFQKLTRVQFAKLLRRGWLWRLFSRV